MSMSLKKVVNYDDKPPAVFPEGFIVKRPGENVPDFVKGKISIKVDEFTKFMSENVNNGWINLDLKISKKGVLYTQLNTWKAEAKVETNDPQAEYNDQPVAPADVPW